MSRIRFRAHPGYRLVHRSALNSEFEERIRGLSSSMDAYGVLLPLDQGSGLTIKIVNTQVAEVFRAYCGSIADAADASQAELLELAYTDILQVEAGGEFLSGPMAHARFAEAVNSDRTDFPAELSRAALVYGSHLACRASASNLAAKLYFYNRVPATGRWREAFSTPQRVREHLRIFQKPLQQTLKDYTTNVSEDRPAWGWWSWSSARKGTRREGGTFKLYISPDCSAISEAFGEVANVLASRRAPAFKIGIDMHGLLRPDKLVAYFGSMEEVQEAACEIEARLAGCPVQGVPFSAALTADGLLSWGIDPPSNGEIVDMGSKSWRGWVTQRLAASLSQAARRNPQSDPTPYALDRLRSLGVDVNTWEMDARRWKRRKKLSL